MTDAGCEVHTLQPDFFLSSATNFAQKIVHSKPDEEQAGKRFQPFCRQAVQKAG